MARLQLACVSVMKILSTFHYLPLLLLRTYIAITCPDLPDPQYGSVELTGNRVGDQANYECDKGFRLSGDSQRECLITGDWSGKAPTCVRKSQLIN